jgi:hypothetical protein
VTAINPTGGPAVGGTAVTISGLGLTGATSVKFGDNPAPTPYISDTDTEIVAESPAGTAGSTVPVEVCTPDGCTPSAAKPAAEYTYDAASRTLTINKTGSGNGSFECKTTGSFDACASTYPEGATVSLTAAPAAGSTFSTAGPAPAARALAAAP